VLLLSAAILARILVDVLREVFLGPTEASALVYRLVALLIDYRLSCMRCGFMSIKQLIVCIAYMSSNGSVGSFIHNLNL